MLSRLAAPVVLLAAGFLMVYVGGALSVSLVKSSGYGAYAVLTVGAAIALVFRSGRALFVLVTLLVAFGAQKLWLEQGLVTPTARAVYLLLAVIVPVNLALFAGLPERGTINRSGGRRLAVIAVEVILVCASVAAGGGAAFDWISRKFLPFGIGALPHVGVIAVCACLIAALAAAFVSRSAVVASCAGAIIAFTIAAHVPAASYTYSTFTIAAGLMVTIAILHDAFRVAFRDKDTGLPSRQALDARLEALPRKYTIAMVDIDRFSEFNRTWGSEVGDQVLRMVGAHIRHAVGRGNAYRYGGEEFVAILPRSNCADALPRLETLRENVESYLFAVRGPTRAKSTRRVRRPGGWKGSDITTVSVSVSIGAADNSGGLATPRAVLEEAERALHRAKERGRNAVSL